MAQVRIEESQLAFSPTAGAIVHRMTRREARFSGLEWSVIALAQKDGLSSLEEPSPMSRAMSMLFGVKYDTFLADDRLETLRRTAVLAWHKERPLPRYARDQFLDADFSLAQYDLLLESVARGNVLGPRGIGWM